MTAVAALIDKDGNAWIGGDSAITWSDRIMCTKNPKVWRTEIAGRFWLVGYAGRGDVFSAIRNLDLSDAATLGSVSIAVYERIQEVLPYFEQADDEPAWSLLVAGWGSLWILSDGSADEVSGDYCAIGSGSEVALGVLSVSAQIDPKSRITAALMSAERHCADVRGPFKILREAEEADPA